MGKTSELLNEVEIIPDLHFLFSEKGDVIRLILDILKRKPESHRDDDEYRQNQVFPFHYPAAESFHKRGDDPPLQAFPFLDSWRSQPGKRCRQEE